MILDNSTMEAQFDDICNKFSMEAAIMPYKQFKQFVTRASDEMVLLSHSDLCVRAACRKFVLDLVQEFIHWVSTYSDRPSKELLKFMAQVAKVYNAQIDGAARERMLAYTAHCVPFASHSIVDIYSELFTEIPLDRDDDYHSQDMTFLAIAINHRTFPMSALLDILNSIGRRGGYYSKELLHLLSSQNPFLDDLVDGLHFGDNPIEPSLRMILHGIGKNNKGHPDCHIILCKCLQYGLLSELRKLLNSGTEVDLVASILHVMIRDGHYSALLHEGIVNSLYPLESHTAKRVIEEIEALF